MPTKYDKQILMSHDERCGIIYGFPKCCIHAYVYDRDNLQEESDFIGTGFKTCKACHANKSTDTIINEINERRVSPIPFSLQINKEQLKYYNAGETFFSDALKLINHDTDLQKLKERIVPVTHELTCYQYQYSSDSDTLYWFAKDLRDNIYTYVFKGGRVAYLNVCIKDNAISRCSIAPPEKAAELRETYPQLYQQNDFIFV